MADIELIEFVCDGERNRAKESLLSAISWMRSTLDGYERALNEGRVAGGSSSTTTEELFQAVGRWDAIVEVSKVIDRGPKPAARLPVSEPGIDGCGSVGAKEQMRLVRETELADRAREDARDDE